MTFIDLNIKKDSNISDFLTFRVKNIAPILAFFLLPSIGSAWSYDKYSASVGYDVSRETSPNTIHIPSSSVANMCKSLLQSEQHTPPNATTDRSQRMAGKVAALGIILGARFAVSPNQTSYNRHDIQANISPRTAHSIAAFRKCQKEHILSVTAYIK